MTFWSRFIQKKNTPRPEQGAKVFHMNSRAGLGKLVARGGNAARGMRPNLPMVFWAFWVHNPPNPPQNREMIGIGFGSSKKRLSRKKPGGWGSRGYRKIGQPNSRIQ